MHTATKLTFAEKGSAFISKIFTVVLAAETGSILMPIAVYLGLVYTAIYISRTFIVPKGEPNDSL